ncbi:nitrate- and nitrite sensing domain-containing protein, partial [Nocardiopsis ansamitocini]|uniref:nitrate- and nitrite sensing domain-containing protein n=1 Tax=Nocardiopsis ansamitocini TaxID=1670832 RepID=UPI0025546654
MQETKKRRHTSIRSRLRRIVLAPTAALVVLWLIVSGYLAYNAFVQYVVANSSEERMLPSAIALVAVMDERSETIAYLERPDEHRETLREIREEADGLMSEVLGSLREVMPLASEPVQARITDLQERFDTIPEVRARVDAGQASRREVQEYYNGLTMAGADLFDTQARRIPSSASIGPGLSATYGFRALDLFAQADTQLSRAFATDELSVADQQEFIRLVGSYREQMTTVHKHLTPEPQRMMTELWEQPEYIELSKLMDTIVQREVAAEYNVFTGEIERDLSMPVDEQEWRELYAPIKATYTEIGSVQAKQSNIIQHEVADEAILTAVLGSLGVALVSVLVPVFAMRSSREVVDRLNRLRDGTQELADRRLPALIDRLGRNEPVDLHTEVPDLDVANDEIGEV